MPRIDVLPTTTKVATPGYALVPDTRGLPAVPQPAGGRKRAARNNALHAGDTTARQQNAILKHLAELDKDSHRDVHIPVPAKQKEQSAGRSSNRKMTSNVRRILTSQKTFANHLADEEAARTQQSQSNQPPLQSNIRRQSGVEKPAIAATSESQAPSDDTDDDPLLRSYVPQAPSAEVMNALTSAPPLSYNDAYATLPAHPPPQRHFCEICGYWGTVKCLKCGARVCGLECKTTHDEGRCLKFYA